MVVDLSLVLVLDHCWDPGDAVFDNRGVRDDYDSLKLPVVDLSIVLVLDHHCEAGDVRRRLHVL